MGWRQTIPALVMAGWLAATGVAQAQAQTQTQQPEPAGVADILALLDREAPDPARVAALTERAARPLPDDADAQTRLRALLDRADAAGELGRLDQRLADLTQARDESDAADTSTRIQLFNDLAQALARSGRHRDALTARAQAIRLQENAQDPKEMARLFGAYAFMSMTATHTGDLAKSRFWLDKLDALLEDSNRWKIASSPARPRWVQAVRRAHAQYEFETGQLAAAEANAREAAALLDGILLGRGAEDDARQGGNMRQARAQTLMLQAQAIAGQGRLAEAEATLLPALIDQIHRRGRDATETAGALRVYADLLLDMGRPADADRIAKTAADSLRRSGQVPSSPVLASALVQQAQSLVDLHRDTEALSLFDTIAQGLDGQTNPITNKILRNDDYALALIRTGQAARAADLLRDSVTARAATLGDDHMETAQTRGLLGVAQAAVGDSAGAIAAFKTALPVLIRGTGSLETQGAPARRIVRLRIIVDSYLGVLADPAAPTRQQGLDAAQESFRIADAALAGTVQRAIAANTLRAAARTPEAADLVRQAQDGRQRLSAINALIAEQMAAPSDQRDGSLASLRADAKELDRTITALDKKIEHAAPDLAQLMRPTPADAGQIAQLLAPDEALVLTYVGENTLFSWAVRQGQPPVFAATPLPQTRLNGWVRSLRAGMDPVGSTTSLTLDVDAAYQLYAATLAPVEAGWKGAARLFVVPDRALGQIPFATLLTEAVPNPVRDPPGSPMFSGYARLPWLIRQVAVAQLPAAAALPSLRGASFHPAARAFIGFGDPIFSQDPAKPRPPAISSRGATLAMSRRAVPSPDDLGAPELDTRGLESRGQKSRGQMLRGLSSLPRLPDTADEIRAIANVLGADPDRDVRLGSNANTASVMNTDLSDRRVVMFATHGLRAGDLRGLTQPALALTAPDIAGGGNGLLTMDDVLKLRLNADWVVLSACNTAAPDGESSEAVSGLGRAFFYAGARAVLVTAWAVETNSAALLTTATFRRIAATSALPRAEALRQASLTVMDAQSPGGEATSFSYAHPLFWAPYVLVGDGR